MGSGGLIEWPSRSPDLTICDYIFTGLYRRQRIQRISSHNDRYQGEDSSNNKGISKIIFKNMKTRLNFVVQEQG